ncbi:MAG: polysaccharide deacetylase family protein [Paludibacteraceae bacterium]|nr:polysaccharide deacetylase family protein [Paludibacteraceae bacterium]
MTETFKNTIRYITLHLLGAGGRDHKADKPFDALAEKVGYTNDEQQWGKYKVVIRPSRFFDPDFYGTEESLPTLPLTNIDGTPLLYGDGTVSRAGETLVVGADIFASAYFMMARYEEYADRSAEKRDQHRRFVGKESVAYKAGFLGTPIVEEYGRLLRTWLREAGEQVDEPKEGISHYYITHDLDMPFYCKTARGLLGAAKRGCAIEGLRNFLSPIEKNKFFTFPMLKSECDKLRDAHKGKVSEIVFVKSTTDGNIAPEDKPTYNLGCRIIKELIEYLKTNGFEIGVHTSYYSGEHTHNAPKETAQLRLLTGLNITQNRYHYLRTLNPQDYQSLADAGITDDFTLGHADVVGFRTGTCREHRWINPKNGEVSQTLWIHPMIMMDCTVGDKKYMALDEEQGLREVVGLINQTRKHHGEVTILFHNSVFSDETFPYEKLYKAIVAELCK